MKSFIWSRELQTRIVAGVRSGGYPQVVAQAWGLPANVFDLWMERGKDPKAPAHLQSFALEVNEAHAQARLRAEMEVFQGDPKIWLEHGPGREMQHRPGWSTATKPCAEVAEAFNALLHPDVLLMMDHLRNILARFPGAIEAVRNEIPSLPSTHLEMHHDPA